MKNKHRKLARKRFWTEHDREKYLCPDCGRAEKEIPDNFEVHHKDGDPHNNSIDNLIGLCNFCHCLREGKKPPLSNIEKFRDGTEDQQSAQKSVSELCDVELEGPMIKKHPQIDPCIVDYVYKHTSDPPHEPWGKPFNMFWEEYQSKYPSFPDQEEELMCALEEIRDAKVKYVEKNGEGFWEVIGVAY